MTILNNLFIKTLCLASLLPVACNQNTSTTTDNTEILPEDIVEMRDDQSKLAGVVTGNIEYRSLGGTLKASGMVTAAPQNYATVCLPMGGFVKSTSLVAGSSVKKGQALATLENQDFVDLQQSYLQAKNKFEFAEVEYKRHTDLFKEEVYSEKNLQEITAEYRNRKAEVRALSQKLALVGINASELNEEAISSSVTLVSPISGYLKSVNINIGKYVSPSDILFEIVNSDNLLLELTLFEQDADKVSNGQKIRFFVNNEAEQHDAIIYQTGKSIGSDKTYKVYAMVEGACKNVLPGMYVNAIIEASGNRVTALPSEAIVSFDDKDYIFVYERDKQEEGKPFTEYRMIEVTKGYSSDGYTQVDLPEGFKIEGARVVIKGAYNLLSAKKNAGEMAC